MKKNNHGFAPIIILVLIALAVVGYFGYKNYWPKVQSLAIPTPTVTTDPTAGWKTFSDKDKEFTFKYPNDWGTLDIGGTLMIAPSADIKKVNEMNNRGGFGGGNFLISLLNIYDAKPEYISNEYANVVRSTIQIDNKMVDKYQTTQLMDAPGAAKGDISISVVIPLKNRYIDYSMLDQRYSNIFDQILSTFQFTK